MTENFALPLITNLHQVDRLIHEHVYKKPNAELVPNYSTNEKLALQIAEKYKLALVPQSDDDGVRWLACDLESVFYDSNITLNPKETEDGEEILWSAKSISLAICLTALVAEGLQFTIVETLV